MTLTPVRSSNIKALGHDPETNTLRVEFHNGAKWDYAGVNEHEYHTLLHSPSVGSHFHKFIRNRKEGSLAT